MVICMWALINNFVRSVGGHYSLQRRCDSVVGLDENIDTIPLSTSIFYLHISGPAHVRRSKLGLSDGYRFGDQTNQDRPRGDCRVVGLVVPSRDPGSWIFEREGCGRRIWASAGREGPEG